jgi:hypothetical protein
MKKIRYFLFIALASGLAILNSCSDSETVTPADETPTINFVGGTGYISSNATLKVNETFKVGINAFSNTTTGENLVKFTITRIFNNVPLTQDTTINTDQLNIEVHATANSQVGAESWYFKVTDKNNKTKEISFTITTEAAVTYDSINEFSMKILGAQDNATGSSFASIDGTVYNITDAKANAAKIDWLYFHGSVNKATLASPADADAQAVFNNATWGIQTWTVKNNTLFKEVTDVVNWASIDNDSLILIHTASGVTNTKVNNLAVNDILSFITVTGKKGMIKVESIDGANSAGTITISVKVQK